jgi:hypothetical protein
MIQLIAREIIANLLFLFLKSAVEQSSTNSYLNLYFHNETMENVLLKVLG